MRTNIAFHQANFVSRAWRTRALHFTLHASYSNALRSFASYIVQCDINNDAMRYLLLRVYVCVCVSK